MSPEQQVFIDALEAWRALTDEERDAWYEARWSEVMAEYAANPDALMRASIAIVPSPEVARQVRLSILRNACPDGTRMSGCGCSGEFICSRDGGRKSREDCFKCLEADHPATDGSAPIDDDDPVSP